MDRKLLNAIRQGNTYQIEKLAHVNRDIFRGRTLQDNTSLHLAAIFGGKHVNKLILNHEPSFLYERNQNDENPLHIATKVGNAYAVETFLKYFRTVGGSVAGQENILRMRDKQGNTPLHKAVRNHHDLVAVLLMNDDPETILLVNEAKQSPLSIAIDTSSKSIYSTYIGWFIIKEHPSSLDYRGPNELTLLHCTVIRQDDVFVAAILESKRDLINELDEYGRNPLHYAAVLGNERIARRLLDADDDDSSLIYKAADSNGKTPLYLAAEKGQDSFFIMLVNSYPDAIVGLYEKQRNILHIAALNGNVDIVRHILACYEIEDLINSPDEDGNTPLHLAAKNFHEKVVDVLSRNRKVDIKATNCTQQTALAIVESSTDRNRDIEKQFLTMEKLRAAITAQAFYPEDILQDDTCFRAMERDFRQIRYEENREMAKTVLVMATLIATFTITAAFTLPGGYEDNGPNEGMAKLVKKSGFIACVITFTISMVSSMTAAVFCLGQICYGKHQHYTNVNLIHQVVIRLVWLGLTSMSLAFITGLFVVLSNNMTLAIVVVCIGCAFPVLLYSLGPFFLGLDWDEIKLVYGMFFEGFWQIVLERYPFGMIGLADASKNALFSFSEFAMLVMLRLYDSELKLLLKYGLYTNPVDHFRNSLEEMVWRLYPRNWL